METQITNRKTFDMTKHSILKQLTFQKNSKAFAFKLFFHSDALFLGDAVMCFSNVQINACGKKIARIKYDGSIMKCIHTKTIKDHLNYQLDINPFFSAAQSFWSLGEWLIIPESNITIDKDIEYWKTIARGEFLRHMKKSYHVDTEPVNAEEYKKITTSIQEDEISFMTVDEWNTAVLSTISPELISDYKAI